MVKRARVLRHDPSAVRQGLNVTGSASPLGFPHLLGKQTGRLSVGVRQFHRGGREIGRYRLPLGILGGYTNIALRNKEFTGKAPQMRQVYILAIEIQVPGHRTVETIVRDPRVAE